MLVNVKANGEFIRDVKKENLVIGKSIGINLKIKDIILRCDKLMPIVIAE